MKIYSQNTFRYKITSFFGKSLIRFLEIIISVFVKRIIVFDAAEFSWAKKVEEKYPDILKEYIAITQSNHLPDICEISEEQYSVIEENYWRFLPLYAYGIPIEENLALCPETENALKLIPNITTVFFSAIKPGTFIKSHRGAYKGYLRYHLGVKIPSPNTTCGLKILDTTYHWENGKSLIFDDTFMHEAWNNSTEERVVLYVDFIRPMPKFLMTISKWLTSLISESPFIQNGIAKLRARKFDAEVGSLLG